MVNNNLPNEQVLSLVNDYLGVGGMNWKEGAMSGMKINLEFEIRTRRRKNMLYMYYKDFLGLERGCNVRYKDYFGVKGINCKEDALSGLQLFSFVLEN